MIYIYVYAYIYTYISHFVHSRWTHIDTLRSIKANGNSKIKITFIILISYSII